MLEAASAGTGPDGIEAAVRAVLGSLSGDMSVTEAALLAELEQLGQTIRNAKAEIAALRVDDINVSHIPSATDELDAIVAHTAAATNEILDCCEVLETMAGNATPADADMLRQVTTRIFEACSFQDITGQRISKVVSALQAIEARVAAVSGSFSGEAAVLAAVPAAPEDAIVLENGPQLPGAAMEQSEIDRLLASFD